MFSDVSKGYLKNHWTNTKLVIWMHFHAESKYDNEHMNIFEFFYVVRKSEMENPCMIGIHV